METKTTPSGPTEMAAPVPFDARLIPEYDGTTDVVEWLTRSEMLCKLRGVALESVLPMRLTGGAFAVWSQLPEARRSSLTAVRDALYEAFALDQYAAYEAFTVRRLRPSESVDVFLADLRRLSALFGGISERALACAFVAGLPDDVRRTIRAGSRAEGLDLASVLARARSVLSDERVAAAGASTSLDNTQTPLSCQPPTSSRDQQHGQPLRGARRPRRCWTCGQLGHLAAACTKTGNDVGGGVSAPASSPARQVLVDTGCTDTIVHAQCCAQWQPEKTSITTISGDSFQCTGVASVTVETPTGQRARVRVLVVNNQPLGVDAILGIAGISALGGIVVKSSTEIHFCGTSGLCGAASAAPLVVDAPDFSVRFNETHRTWTVTWKWTNGAAPDCLCNAVAQYNVPPSMRQEYDKELESWIMNGWLVPYDEEQHGAPRGLVSLMAVRQNNGGKVRPVMDYRELNDHVTAFTADSDVCADQLRKWRRHGVNVAVLDLRKAYLQLRVDRQLWPFQTVIVRGQRYCLTRLGFGLNVAPLVMKAVVKTILAQDPEVQRAVLPYVDDLLVNEDLVSAERVTAHFAAFGLECKQPDRVVDGARLLGLRVQSAGGQLQWSRDNPVNPPPSRVTRRAVFAWCGRLIAHLPVGGWLRPAAAWLKRRVNEVTRGWDDVVEDDSLRKEMECVATRLVAEDPCRGLWSVRGDQAVVWTDASALAAGVVVETPQGDVIEDACWLRRDESSHINMAELDAAVRGINLAIAWGMRIIELRTDSATVHRWIDDALSGRARLRTKAHGEMLIRRRVDVIRQLATEFGLVLTVTLVRSAENSADALTRVPEEWVRRDRVKVSAVAVGERSAAVPSITDVHVRAGHPGIRRTLFFARREISRAVTRAEARTAVKQCDVCCNIDPAPVKWRHGTLNVTEPWWRLAIDITHYLGRAYLSVIDCGPSRFCVWRLLRRPDAETVVDQLEQVFYERGAPVELLSDNDTIFRGRRFAAFAAHWGVSLRFRAAYAPTGNGIVERNHRTVKVIAARKKCSIAEAVHLYNVTPRDGTTIAEAPANGVYRYEVRDCVRSAKVQHAGDTAPGDNAEYTAGDTVWVRERGERCTVASHPGVVTGINSPQVLEVDGVPRHVRDLRHRNHSTSDDSGQSEEHEPGDEAPLYISAEVQQTQQTQSAATAQEAVLRRSTRVRRPPERFGYDLVDQGGV